MLGQDLLSPCIKAIAAALSKPTERVRSAHLPDRFGARSFHGLTCQRSTGCVAPAGIAHEPVGPKS